MEEVTRKLIFERAADKLRTDFEELRTIPHSGLRGQEGEILIRDFLNTHLPKRFAAGAGFIIDRQDNVSRQTDVVVYDSLNCPMYRASDEASIFPSDNTAAVVEVKSRLDKDALEDSANKISAVKRLAKTRPPNLPILVQCNTLGIVFAFESALTLETLAQHYHDSLAQKKSLGDHIDFIFVLDVGMISLFSNPKGIGWAPTLFEGLGGSAGEGAHIGVGATRIGKPTLDAFLRMLLAHLQFFRGLVDHPGFNWSEGSGPQQAQIFYLTSITHEKDPTKRAAIMAEYQRQVREEFGQK